MSRFDCLSKISPVNSLVVLIKKGGESYTNSGLVVYEENKAVNFGVVLKKPVFLTEAYKEYEELLSSINEGDEVIFNVKITYNLVKVENCFEAGYEMLLVSPENIQAVIKKERNVS